MPCPRHQASKISSKRSQSERVAQNKARNAGLSDDGRVAAGDASTATRVAALGQPDLEAVVAQRAREARQPPARSGADRVVRLA